MNFVIPYTNTIAQKHFFTVFCSAVMDQSFLVLPLSLHKNKNIECVAVAVSLVAVLLLVVLLVAVSPVVVPLVSVSLVVVVVVVESVLVVALLFVVLNVLLQCR